MRKQQVLLEDETDRPSLGRHADPSRWVFQYDPVQHDAPGPQGQETGERSQEGGLARPVRTQHGDQFSGGNPQLHVDLKGSNAGADSRLERHDAPSQRSRSPISTASETPSRTRLRTMAASGLLSNAR